MYWKRHFLAHYLCHHSCLLPLASHVTQSSCPNPSSFGSYMIWLQSQLSPAILSISHSALATGLLAVSPTCQYVLSQDPRASELAVSRAEVFLSRIVSFPLGLTWTIHLQHLPTWPFSLCIDHYLTFWRIILFSSLGCQFWLLLYN